MNNDNFISRLEGTKLIIETADGVEETVEIVPEKTDDAAEATTEITE